MERHLAFRWSAFAKRGTTSLPTEGLPTIEDMLRRYHECPDMVGSETITPDRFGSCHKGPSVGVGCNVDSPPEYTISLVIFPREMRRSSS